MSGVSLTNGDPCQCSVGLSHWNGQFTNISCSALQVGGGKIKLTLNEGSCG